MQQHNKLWLFVPLTLTFFLLPALSPAQSTALLTGLVVDPSGAAVPAAEVICRNVETDARVTTATGAQGLFRCPDLPVGPYELKVSHASFRPLVRAGIQLLTGQTVDLKLSLQLGQTSQSVEVSAPAPLVQSTTSDLGTTVDSRGMSDLPLNGRNAFDLAVLTAGAVETSAGTIPDSQDNNGLAVNGQGAVDNDWQLDGATYTNRSFGSAPTLPNPDTLQEFTVRTSNFDASNRGGGASVKLTTRGGTNQMHGTLFEFLRNEAMDARNFFSLEPERYKQNQYGGTLGGPIRKDKLFYFGSFQGTNKRGNPSPASFTVPTALTRVGDYSQSKRVILDPTNKSPFAGNVIPRSRLDATALGLLSYIPLPNSGASTFVAGPPADKDDYQWLVKIDYMAGTKDHISGRYFLDRSTSQYDVNSFPGFYADNRFTNQTLMVSDTRTFSPSWVMRASFNYLRTFRRSTPRGPVTMQALGVNVPFAAEQDGAKINVRLNGYANLWTSYGAVMEPAVSEFQVDFSHASGRHFLRFGSGFRHNVDNTWNGSNDAGGWTFTAARTASGQVKNSGDTFASFLLGAPALFTQASTTPNQFVVTTIDPWVQDDWKISRRLTLNLGLRWEPWLPPRDTKGYLPGFLPGAQSTVAPLAPTGLVFSGDAGIPDSVVRNHWGTFSPRFGFAWDVDGNGKTILRGGYGIFRSSTEFFGLIRNMANYAPFRSASVSINNPVSTADPYAGYGAAPFPYQSPSSLSNYTFPANVVVRALDPLASPGYTQSWNFTVERQVAADSAVTVSYVGNRPLGLMTRRAANPALYGPGATVENTEARRLYPGFGDLTLGGSFGAGNYHGLQAQFTKRARRGLTVMANYTWSKAMSIDSSGVFGTALGEGPRNPLNLRMDYAPADFDVTHQFKVAVIYDIPALRTGPAALRALVRQWQVNSMVTARTGFAFTCRSGVDNSLSSVGNDTCDQIDSQSARPAGEDPLRPWFNTAAFTTNAIGTFGQAGRNSLRRPGVFNANLSVFRHFQLTEGLRVEFRAEAFNVLNHANFDLIYSPSAYMASQEVTSPNFGRITHAQDPRLMQLALKLRF